MKTFRSTPCADRELRVARSSRALAKASRLRGLPCAFATRCAMNFTAIHVLKSSSWRDAKTSTRDVRAPRNQILPRLPGCLCRTLQDYLHRMNRPSFACPNFHAAMSRRAALKVGGLGLLGLSMPNLLRAEALAKADKIKARAKSVIFLFQWGGPSHLDMFDMKPDAPEGIRGPHKAMASKADGIQVSEHLPRTARVMANPPACTRRMA